MLHRTNREDDQLIVPVIRPSPLQINSWQRCGEAILDELKNWLSTSSEGVTSICGLMGASDCGSLHVRLFFNLAPGQGYDRKISDDISELDLKLTDLFSKDGIEFSAIELPYFIQQTLPEQRVEFHFIVSRSDESPTTTILIA